MSPFQVQDGLHKCHLTRMMEDRTRRLGGQTAHNSRWNDVSFVAPVCKLVFDDRRRRSYLSDTLATRWKLFNNDRTGALKI